MIEAPVVIIGGGPVGLTCSILLSKFKIPSILLEQHVGALSHPKTRTLDSLSMEVFRQNGIEENIRKVGLEKPKQNIWVQSLEGEELERRMGGFESMSLSQNEDPWPVRPCHCSQNNYEPVLRAYAESLGPGKVFFGTSLTGIKQNANNITLSALDHKTNSTFEVQSNYVIGADGAHSFVRNHLGISMKGPGTLWTGINIQFEADLQKWTQHRLASVYFIVHQKFMGAILTVDGSKQWVLLVSNLEFLGLNTSDFDEKLSSEYIRLAVGTQDLSVRVISIVPWRAEYEVAEKFQLNRFFLAGDSAHLMPSVGGFGMNGGIQDANNLIWKLAAVQQGWAGESLLETYSAERIPATSKLAQVGFENLKSLGVLGARPAEGNAGPNVFRQLGLLFGTSYKSSAVIQDGTPEIKDSEVDYIPSARPGCRAPKFYISYKNKRTSSSDLFGGKFVLLTGVENSPWADAIQEIKTNTLIPIESYNIGDSEFAKFKNQWLNLYEIEKDGAVLVRPDGFVAWRSRSGGDFKQKLKEAFSQILWQRK